MQTFAPYADFEQSLRTLHLKRLGKQRVEVIQIVRALTVPGYAWSSHPAVLMWVVGNELNLESRDPRVWNAVNDLAVMIHREDPHHPVMTTLALVVPT